MNKLITELQSIDNSYSADVKQKTEELISSLYKLFFSSKGMSEAEVIEEIEQCNLLLNNLFRLNGTNIKLDIYKFSSILWNVISKLKQDAEFIKDGDPSAHSMREIVSCFPGLFAIMVYRMANTISLIGAKVLPRLMTEFAHRETGIDINPEATIGVPFFIDHGTGVVIGQTSVIGNYVKIYQGVTIGALNLKNPEIKRHPTIEDNVTIYSGATILGGNTVVGNNSIIGGNVWLTKSVKPYSLVQNDASVTIKNINPL